MNRPKIAGARYHFIGAGGVGMSGLARFLLEHKALVSGSDQAGGATTARLNGLGADIHVGHSAENLSPGTDTVVISAAIRETNPELQLARQRGCHVYKYAQFLGELMNSFDGIAISGTHGKSTTTGWLVWCLKQAGIDVNFVVGADSPQLGGSSGSGSSELFVAEACEYDRSFQNLKPRIACILNIERDHLDCYKDEDDIVESFYQFARGTKPDGLIVANGQDSNVAKVLRRISDLGRGANPQSIVTFGLDSGCNFYAANIQQDAGYYGFDMVRDGERLGSTRISLPGLHNVYNATAVVAMAVSVGVEPQRVLEVLDGFQGMDRRLMLKGQFGGISVIDDYAHHPTKIKASLRAVRERYQPERLWCVFQAHQYSRTQSLLDEFAASFADADKVLIPEIFAARDTEASRSAVSAKVLAERIRGRGTDAQYVASLGAVCDCLEQNVHAGDVVVTMGAGDVWKVADEYIQRLRRNH
ncbi:MAG: UDP-N-acetylmuramate--L-alanine ligase [Phycisphaerae bacterium]|nr:UDP-N-acetylmuramate--L-alanine ligase [Phycisphaerae bacterium]